MIGSQKHSNELKEQVLSEIKEVGNVSLVSKKHGLTDKTVHNWVRATRNKVQNDQAKEVRELHKKLKDAELENYVLKELLKKTHHRWQNVEKL